MSNAEASAFEQVTRERVLAVEEELKEYKRRMNGSLDKIEQRLAAIERQLNSRPSWTVSLTITLLSSITVGLITFLATTGR